MKVFIFGAGASLGSIHDPRIVGDSLPPLSDEIFGSRYDSFAQEVNLSPAELNEHRVNQGKSGVSLEKWLTAWWDSIASLHDEALKNTERSSFARLTCYLWWMLQNVSKQYDGNNGYRLLLKKIRQKQEVCVYINFNYDTLLDRAIQEVNGIALTSRPQYLKAKYIKPHGSVNWFLGRRANTVDPDLESGDSYDPLIRFDVIASQMFLEPKFSMDHMQIFQPNDVNLNSTAFIHNYKFSHQYAYPLLFMPLTSKLYPLVQGFYEEIVSESEALLSEATEVYLVGYSASDKILDDICKNLPDNVILHVVGQDSAASIMEKVLERIPSLRCGVIHDKGFKDFIENYL